MKKNNMYISTNLQYLRKQKKKTQKDIGDLCNKTDTAVSNWEKGIREPDTIDLGILANYFEITVDDIMFKDLRLQDATIKGNDYKDEFDLLYSKSKDILNDAERDMIRYSMQRAIDRYEEEKKKGND